MTTYPKLSSAPIPNVSVQTPLQWLHVSERIQRRLQFPKEGGNADLFQRHNICGGNDAGRPTR
eukprot:CAMPEP_0195521772 /NCGR_PEP_ID=MMETSP0794_2-20130614/19322_1 /TAXON_ID=515487 /ORGANISM="Stephanopyxis turris, Strain CCMP 815" /LENGTH=62 /DNA_ID=CAMNT_0040651391 /DNA_START=554 /DNA_END=742 /DNA_ORIENTATION=-